MITKSAWPFNSLFISLYILIAGLQVPEAYSANSSVHQLGKLKIEVNQDSFSANLIVRQGKKAVGSQTLFEAQSAEQASKLKIPTKQPIKNHFVLKQEGGTLNQMIVIDQKGVIHLLLGSDFYTTPDQKYIFGIELSDFQGSAFSLFQFKSNQSWYSRLTDSTRTMDRWVPFQMNFEYYLLPPDRIAAVPVSTRMDQSERESLESALNSLMQQVLIFDAKSGRAEEASKKSTPLNKAKKLQIIRFE